MPLFVGTLTVALGPTGFSHSGRLWYISSMAKQPSPRPTGNKKSVQKNAVQTLLGTVGAGLRKMPTTFVLVLIGLFIYFRSPEEVQTPQPSESEEAFVQEEPQPPGDLPEDISPAFWTCVYRTDTQLSESRWADIYYGMEASDYGRSVSVTITQEWANLAADQRTTVVDLVVATWQKNSQDLDIFASGEGLEKVTLKAVENEETVAVWTPDGGVQLLEGKS